MGNVRLNYRYSDAANYKVCDEVVFADPDKSDLEEAAQRLCARFDGGEFFIAGQLGIPELFLWKQEGYHVEVDDHCFHTFDGLEATDDPPTDPRTFAEFLATVEGITKWAIFDPAGYL